MKKFTALILALLLIFCLCSCSNSMNYIISHKPSVTGIVTEVNGDYAIIRATDAAGYPGSSDWHISLHPENADSYTDVAMGDEITVYFDGDVMETDPLQIGTVYAITLKTPADRAANNNP